jgi:hypothetical protein
MTAAPCCNQPEICSGLPLALTAEPARPVILGMTRIGPSSLLFSGEFVVGRVLPPGADRVRALPRSLKRPCSGRGAVFFNRGPRGEHAPPRAVCHPPRSSRRYLRSVPEQETRSGKSAPPIGPHRWQYRDLAESMFGHVGSDVARVSSDEPIQTHLVSFGEVHAWLGAPLPP